MYRPGHNEEAGRAATDKTTYPLNTDDYLRLKSRRRRVNVQIIQVVSPALCEVTEVQVSEHGLYTIPLAPSVSGDPEASSLIDQQKTLLGKIRPRD